jgi:hypothetical protein
VRVTQSAHTAGAKHVPRMNTSCRGKLSSHVHTASPPARIRKRRLPVPAYLFRGAILSACDRCKHATVIDVAVFDECRANQTPRKSKGCLGSNPDSRVVSSRLSSVPDLEDECIPFWILYGMSVDIFCFFVNRFSYTILICFSSLPCFVL